MSAWLPHPGYFTLMASLPHLPRFDRAQRLPINRERLDARLAWLRPDDARIVRQAEQFLEWQRLPLERTDAQMVAHYLRLMTEVGQPALRAMLEFRFGLRVVLSALRRRRSGLPAPARGETWAAGPWAGDIQRNWTEPDFRLAAQCPWLPQARALLQGGETLALERLLMGVVWDHLGAVGRGHYFDLEAVLVYLFRWDILDRWLRYRPAAAALRIDRLVREALRDGDRLFA
jgi:hypothetical protein